MSEGQRPQTGSRIRILIGVALIVAALIAIFEQIGGRILSKRSQQAIRGATKSEVVRVLGTPNEMLEDGREWIYTRFANPGWVEVRFDENDRVASINDESAFP